MFKYYRLSRRLAAEVKTLRSRAEYLEKERERLIRENRERDLAWADRFLTHTVKAFAIGDEAKAKAAPEPSPQDYNEKLQRFLDSKEYILREDAKEAELPNIDIAVKAEMERNMNSYIVEFNNQSPFKF